jgi:uncharacterized membrane protein
VHAVADWAEFALAMAVFLLSHVIPVRPPVRPAAVRLLGQGGFTAAYSALSLLVLAWLIGAAGRAPFVPLWPWAPWQNHVVLLAMLVVCLIVALSIGRPNPFSFGGGRGARFDPQRPGLVRWMRHPLLVALAIWAGAHMLANGNLAHVLLFGTFAAFALLGQRLVDRRRQRLLGPDWQRQWQAVRAAPRRPLLADGMGLRAAAGVGLYAALIVLHPLLFGVSPLP